MKKYALVNSEGQIEGSVELSDPSIDLEGIVSSGLTHHEIDFNKDISKSTCLWWWNGVEWAARDAQPTELHVWTSGTWAPDVDALWEYIRAQRTKLLSASDWTQLPDASITDAEKALWTTYRQQLRDMPQDMPNAQTLLDINWPLSPTDQV